VDEHLMELSEALRIRLNGFLQNYGLEMPEFFVSRVMTPDDDPNFKRMKQQYADQYLLIRQEQIKRSEAEAAQARKTVEAQTDAQMKIIGAQGAAEALKIQKAAEAEAYRMQAEAEATEMRMKGYTYQQETSRQVGMEAMKNGIGSGVGGASVLGDLAGLGIGLGAMGGVIDMTKNAMSPVMGEATQMGQNIVTTAAPADTWDCVCGTKGITSKFCPECGTKRPEIKKTWDCPNCGTKDIASKFCPECGTKREG
jgi:membrane protease subunit (stomatin/prohibitin family)